MICKVVRQFSAIFIATLVLAPFTSSTLAEELTTPAVRGSYHSDVDDLLSMEKVSVLPFTDNLQGIYSRPLESHFITQVEAMHRWDYVPSNSSGPILAPEELEDDPEKAKQACAGLGVDAFFAGRVTKGPNGITVHISLFLSKDGKLLSQAILKDYPQFNLADLKEQTQRLLEEITTRLPYSGRVMSRDGNRVTVNLGTRDGVQLGQMLSVVQILQVQRHPKFNFLIHADKEIFGKLKILKVDETLSFATVVSEKERGAIQKNSKIGPLDFVTYPGGEELGTANRPEDNLAQTEAGAVAFGKDPTPWKPQSPPMFGQVGGRFGLSRVSENMELDTVGTLSATDNFAATIRIEGDLWITSEWTFHARIEQGFLQVGNPRSTASPGTLNQLESNYEAGLGYMFRLGPHVWSPYVEPTMSYFTYRLYSDDSTPQSFTTMNYSGFKLGLRGSTPIDATNIYGVGGEFDMAISPHLTESPYSSGDSSTNSAVDFGVFVYKKMGERLKLQGELEFTMFSSSFSGNGTRQEPATSASQRYTTLSGGVYYMF